jgi:hypothetical protein
MRPITSPMMRSPFAPRAARHRQLQPLHAGHRGRHAVRRGARVVALPGAGQQDVARHAFGIGHREHAPAVGHVVPQQPAGLFQVDRLEDHEGRQVAHLAVAVLGELDVLDDPVARQRRVELAEGAPGHLLVGDADPRRGGHRQHLVDHDARDARLRRSAGQGRQGPDDPA